MDEKYCLVSSGISQENRAFVIDLTTGSIVQTFRGRVGRFDDLQVVSNNNDVVTCSSQTRSVEWWNLKRGFATCISSVPDAVCRLCLTGNNNYLIGGTSTGKLYVWNAVTGDLSTVVNAHLQGGVCCLANSGLYIVSGGIGSICLWSLMSLISGESSSSLVSFYSFGLGTVSSLSFGTLGIKSWLLATTESSLLLIDVANSKLIHKVRLPSPGTCCCRDTLDSISAAGCSGGEICILDHFRNNKNNIQIENASTSVLPHPLPEEDILRSETAGVVALSFVSSASMLVSSHNNGHLCVWHVGERQLMKRIESASVAAIGSMSLLSNAYSPSTSSSLSAYSSVNVERAEDCDEPVIVRPKLSQNVSSVEDHPLVVKNANKETRLPLPSQQSIDELFVNSDVLSGPLTGTSATLPKKFVMSSPSSSLAAASASGEELKWKNLAHGLYAEKIRNTVIP